MSGNASVAEERHRLEELGQRIRAARTSLGAHRQIAAQADEDWADMVSTHAAISRKLEAAHDQPAQVLEGVRADIDVLRHAFERWMARVEGGFARDGGRHD